jgi:hypothetical protein
MLKQLLIICSDVIGARMAGPAIRCIELARSLSSDFDVTVAAPEISGVSFDKFRLIVSDSKSINKIAPEVDLILFQGAALVKFPILKSVEAVLISDLYCPVPLEYHQSSGAADPKLRMLTAISVSNEVATQIQYADHFICASERQRDFWLGAFAISGRINGLRWPDAAAADISDLISIVPFGISDTAPVKDGNGIREMFSIPVDEFVAIWGGGVYEWFDPLVVIQAIAKLESIGKRCHLVFVGVKHPNVGVGQHDMCSKAIVLAERLGLMGRLVHFNFGWVDYSKRHNYLLDADVGVSAHFNNPETRFSFRTRILDYLWCGLPIICTKGDVFGDLVEAKNLGCSVNYGDVDGWVVALGRLMLNKDDRTYFSEQSTNLGKDYQWSKSVPVLKAKMLNAVACEDRLFVRKNRKFSGDRLGFTQRVHGAYARGGMRLIANYFLIRLLRFVGLR